MPFPHTVYEVQSPLLNAAFTLRMVCREMQNSRATALILLPALRRSIGACCKNRVDDKH